MSPTTISGTRRPAQRPLLHDPGPSPGVQGPPLRIGSIVVRFGGSCLKPYKVIPTRNCYGAYGYGLGFVAQLRICGRSTSKHVDCWPDAAHEGGEYDWGCMCLSKFSTSSSNANNFLLSMVLRHKNSDTFQHNRALLFLAPETHYTLNRFRGQNQRVRQAMWAEIIAPTTWCTRYKTMESHS